MFYQSAFVGDAESVSNVIRAMCYGSWWQRNELIVMAGILPTKTNERNSNEKYIHALIALLGLATVAFAATDSQIWGEMLSKIF